MSYYDLLEVHRGASSDEIRKAFKRVALKHHPDKGGDENTFKLCVEALETLSDVNKRAAYDYSSASHSISTSFKSPEQAVRKDGSKNPCSMTVNQLKLLLESLGLYHDDCFDKRELLSRLERKSGFSPLRAAFTAEELKNATRIKIISLGSEAVGKSCLIKRFCEGKFSDRYISTIGVDYGVRPVEILSSSKYVVKINFFDFSGLRVFADVRSEFYEGSQGIMLVFDLSNLQSFRNISDWVAEARSHGISLGVNATRHCVLVGNKSDFSRVVTFSEGFELANKLCATYFETSALTGEGVNDAFMHLTAKIAA